MLSGNFTPITFMSESCIMCSCKMKIMVSILQYQYEPESDPESGDEESQAGFYKTFLNGNFLKIIIILFSSTIII